MRAESAAAAAAPSPQATTVAVASASNSASAASPAERQHRQPLLAPGARELGIGAFAEQQGGVGRQPHGYLGIRTHMSKSSTTLGS